MIIHLAVTLASSASFGAMPASWHKRPKATSPATAPSALPRIDKSVEKVDNVPLDKLESELASMKAEKVIISTALLRKLLTSVSQGKQAEIQCKDLSDQLEAIKSADVEAVE